MYFKINMFYILHNYLHFGTLFYPRDYVQNLHIVIAQNLVELKNLEILYFVYKKVELNYSQHYEKPKMSLWEPLPTGSGRFIFVKVGRALPHTKGI